MSEERRNPESGSIRSFFQEQWGYIGKLIDSVFSKNNEYDISHEIVESVVNATNSRIRIVSNYKKKLRQSVKSLLDYVELLVHVIPPPINASPDHFGEDQHLNAFFVNKEHIAETFGNSIALREYFKAPENTDNDVVYAILLMNRQEKKVLGTQHMGDMLMGDVKQTSVSFTNHIVQSPVSSEEGLRSVLKQLMFDNFIAYVKRHMAYLHYEQQKKEDNKKYINPENYLNELCQILENPHELFGLETSGYHINRLGVLVDENEKGPVNKLNLREILFGDDERHIVVLVSFPRDKMSEKKDFMREASRILGPL